MGVPAADGWVNKGGKVERRQILHHTENGKLKLSGSVGPLFYVI